MRTRPRTPLSETVTLCIAGVSLLFSAIGAGCEDAESTAPPATPVQSDAAEDVQNEEAVAAPVRVAALLPFAADQLIEMGAPPVAVPLIRGDMPEAWDGIMPIAIDHSAGPNIEQLIAVDPDVVVTSAVYSQFLESMKQSTGAEIVIMDVDSVDEVEGHIERLGEIAQRQDEAAALVESIDASISDLQPEGEPVRVLAVFGTPHAFYTFLPSSYLGDLVSHAGGELITEDMESHGVFRGLAPLSMEAVIDRDPDQLMVVFHGSEESARAMLEQDSLWSQLSAVRNGHVAFLRDDLYAMRPGSELPRAISEIQSILEEARSRQQ